jgi:hypothetical protein
LSFHTKAFYFLVLVKKNCLTFLLFNWKLFSFFSHFSSSIERLKKTFFVSKWPSVNITYSIFVQVCENIKCVE